MTSATASRDSRQGVLGLLSVTARRLAIEAGADRPNAWNPRPNQLAPDGEWGTWLILSGRGWGKTRTGAEWVKEMVSKRGMRRGAIVAPTAADLRDTIVEGESGILESSDPWFRPVYEPSKRRVVWPNGARVTLYSGEEPDRLRGPNHDFAWVDELAAMRRARAVYDMLMFTLRKGVNPQALFTTTPRPIAIIREIMRQADTVVVRGNTYENIANLSQKYIERNIAPYEGTRLGRQEIAGEILDDVEGALWSYAILDAGRVGEAPSLDRIVVGVDPSGGGGENHDEAGIIVAGRAGKADALAHYFTLADYSLNASPDAVAREIVRAQRDWGAHRIVAEGNYGGDMVRALIRTVDPEAARLVEVVHATQGKAARAQPIAAIYEQGRGHHVGTFKQLEDELTSWVEGEASPNRLDALVWAHTALSKPTKRMTAA